MKLDLIEREHILAAAYEIQQIGKSNDSEYIVYINERNDTFPFKQLVRIAYRIATGTTITNDFFQSNAFYRGFMKRKFGYWVYNKKLETIPFFSAEDIELFAEYAGTNYNESLRHIGDNIKKRIFDKTNLWAKSLSLDGFDFDIKLHWQRRGYFEKYSWARIYRKGEKSRKIFFTVGVDAEEEALVYKLDCYYSSALRENALSFEQHETFKRIVEHSPAKWNGIYLSDLPYLDWESLLEKTRQFILEFASLYDEIIAAVWDLPLVQQNTVIPLRLKPIPKGIVAPPEKKQKQFQGNADYEGDAIWKKQIGDAGEDLVMQLLKKELIDAGKPDFADKVHKVADWNGYDILAYDTSGNERYIEVKTTTGSELRSFFWTINELITMQNNTGNYFLYRLYNFNSEQNTADFYILDGDFSNRILIQPTVFEIYIKEN